MSQQSVRSQSVRKPTFATSPTLPFARASSERVNEFETGGFRV
jgi:hypothetical protein